MPSSQQQNTIDWSTVLLTAAALGWHPEKALKSTLPELQIAVKGWRQRHGLASDPSSETMSRRRLMELIEQNG